MGVYFRDTALLLLVAALLSTACATGFNAPPADGTKTTAALRVLDETFIDGGTAESITSAIVPTESGYTVEVSATGAQDLKALFFELDYDPKRWHPAGIFTERWHPAGTESTGQLGDAAELITLSNTTTPGVVTHGQVVANYDTHPGFSGDGVLARVKFVRGPALPQRRAATLPPAVSAGPLVLADYTNRKLRVYYGIRGDLDMNGEVNVADILPISRYYSQQNKLDNVVGRNWDGTWNDTSRAKPVFYADGNTDGEVNQADITEIVLNYGQSISGFTLCASTDYPADYPFGGTVTEPSAVLGTRPLPTALGNAIAERTWWEFSVPTMAWEQYFWVHPLSAGETGPASMVALDDGGWPAAIDKEYGLAYDLDSGILSWNSNLRGDYNMNTEVNLSDTTPLAVNFGSSWPFTSDSYPWVTDGNRDGVVDQKDVQILGQLFGNQERYTVYSTTNPQAVPHLPTDADEFQPAAVLEGYGDFTKDSMGIGFRERVSVDISLASGRYVYIRMRSADGVEGPRSEVIQIP